jgi:aspartyl-tRNA(Asn)/glutamyl-tRNA(Gln) amidotransferase subunit A
MLTMRCMFGFTAASESSGPLSSLTVAVKDIFCTTDLPTTCASNMLRGKHFTCPHRIATMGFKTQVSLWFTDYYAPEDATVVSALRKAGASIVGKTNMDEFGMG